jgi:RNA polymerase sigma-70 factor (ECF subfamily)
MIRSAPIDLLELAREHYDLVYRFCARRVGVDGAADAAQETFLTAQRAAKRFRGESTPKTWLLGIALNECRRMVRKKRSEAPLLELEPVSTVQQEHHLIDRQILQSALNSLSPDHREVVLLHEVEGLTYLEAARVLGVPEGTVKSRLHHAFLQLRRALQTTDEVIR